MAPLKVAVLGVQVPFTRGGAEILCDRLVQELRLAGHQAELVTLPFVDHSKESILQQIRTWQRLDLSSADVVVATKFPSYFVKHPRKVLWLVHQHRQMYELLGSRFSDFEPDELSEALRRKVMRLEREAISECQVRSCISANVCERLERYLGVPSIPLPPPLPLGERYFFGEKGNYILSVGRLCSIKRVELALKSLPAVHNHIRLKIVGVADEKNYAEYLRNECDKHHLQARVDFLGRVSDEELLQLYAGSMAVFYGPYDEDYGFVTLEALKSGKPVITCKDSGGVLGFVRDGYNGLIVPPTISEVSVAINRLCESNELYSKLCEGAQSPISIPTWKEVVDLLVGQEDTSSSIFSRLNS